jgi:hypothetical protein
MSIIDITHLYDTEKENPIYMLIDLKNGQEMTIHNKESLPNKRYPTDFLNMDMDLHIRRIL